MAKRKVSDAKTGACWACGATRPVQRGHILPRNLFPRGERPSNLPTLPECANCNQGASNDDEYFCFAILAQASLTSPDANKVLDQAKRSTRDRTKLAHRYLQNAEQWSEPVLGIGGRLELELERVGRTLRRVVAGLYRLEFDEPLPSSHTIRTEVEPEEDVRRGDLYKATRSAPERVFGQRVVTYRVLRSEDHQYSAWLLRFYDAVEAVAFTHPPIDEQSGNAQDS